MNTQTTPKDFFLHLAATVALYAAVGSLINLAFSVINYFNPDTLAGYFYAGSVAWPISMLIVLVPILYVLEWMIARDIAKTPKKKEMWIRRWRTYLTIFLAGLLMAGDLITLINVYLSGEISSRFVYKVIVIILVAGAIGKYYFFDLYDTYRYATLAKRFNAWFGIAAPKGTPDVVIQKLQNSIEKIISRKEMVESLSRLGATAMFMNTESATKFMKADTDRWRKVVDYAKIQLD